jgi:hypothetical protein
MGSNESLNVDVLNLDSTNIECMLLYMHQPLPHLALQQKDIENKKTYHM